MRGRDAVLAGLRELSSFQLALRARRLEDAAPDSPDGRRARLLHCELERRSAERDGDRERAAAFGAEMEAIVDGGIGQ